jgi:spore germination protein YaaH
MRQKKQFWVFCCLVAAVCAAPMATQAESYSAHGAQENIQVSAPSEDMAEIEALEKAGTLHPLATEQKATPKAATPQLDNDFVSFGYVQSESIVYHLRWQALTHVGSLFVNFDANGDLINESTFTGRSSYLKSGGAADAAGVKVLVVVRNSSFSLPILETVMQSATLRENLAQNIADMVTADSYCHGVNLDFEGGTWTTDTRDGITDFFSRLRGKLPAPTYEVTVYTDPTHNNSNKYDIPGIEPNIDWLNQSCYPWGGSWSTLTHAITDGNSFLGQTINYLEAGLPPEKMVLTLGTYGRNWATATQGYGAATDGQPHASDFSNGFTDGLFDTTLTTQDSGPHTNNYETGDETGWYAYNDGTYNRTALWEDPRAFEFKVRQALSVHDSGDGIYAGRRLRGVGFWSLMWLAETSSINPLTGGAVSRTRTYPHIYRMTQEALAAPGTTKFVFDGFEGLDARWRDPNDSPDTSGDTDSDSWRTVATKPAGSGAPADSTNCMRVVLDFENASGNQAFFRHEVLASPKASTTTDYHASVIHVDQNTAFSAYLNTPSAYTGREISMVLMDADGELEISDPYTLGASGWREITWDLTDASQINAYSTAEDRSTNSGAYYDGDGTLDSAGGGERDISFIGFFVEGGAAGQLNIYLDELAYEHVSPGGDDYVINEFRYNVDTAEFVEIYGPAGAIPAGMQLRVFDSSDGSYTSIALSGTIPNDTGTGYGYYVAGDGGTPNVDQTTGFSSGDDLPNVDPSAIQLYSTTTGCVYDSVVYKAFGGLNELVRLETMGVTGEGFPWLGDIANGVDSTGQQYVMGRYPDGFDTQVNYDDFSVMKASSGVSNGGAISTDVTLDFESTPTEAFLTFPSLNSGAMPSGVSSSPSGGNVYRTIDTSGGGNMAYFGDAALGSSGLGHSVTGELYVSSGSHPAQAIAVGLCGKQGSNFFTASAYTSGAAYEGGYMLLYENVAGVGLNDGQADHPGEFQLLHVTHDNMDGTISTVLGSATATSLGITVGNWTDFELSINPNADLLQVKVNNGIVYNGSIPANGPTTGAFQVGFRENHTGLPGLNEGTWIDNLDIQSSWTVPVELDYFAVE